MFIIDFNDFFIKVDYKHIFSINGMTETTNFCLTTSQVISIYEINPNIKTILLVDDVIFNLKIICLKIRYVYNRL